MCAWARVSALPRHFWLGVVVRALGFGFGGNPATPGWGLGRVCLVTGLAALHLSWPGLVMCVCVGLSSSCSPPFLVLGVGACGLSRAPRLFPATLCWGCLWRGVVRGLPWVGFVPPPFLFFFFGLRGRCGSWPYIVVALWSRALPVPALGLLVSVLPSPFVWVASMFFFFSFRWPAISPVGCVLACPWCPLLGRAAVLGWLSPGLAGWSPGVLLGGPVGVAFVVAWLGGLPASCGVGTRPLGCDTVSCPPSLFSDGRAFVVGQGLPPSVRFVCPFFSWGGGIRLFLPLPSLGWCNALVGIRCG